MGFGFCEKINREYERLAGEKERKREEVRQRKREEER